ncbi:MAG: phosphohydrolase [Gracilibacter sp. BRH_c7a]|nr:MAG: phosphohydrolase [Gracilibacter sp. BRH_c7a]
MGDQSLGVMGFTEHSFQHAFRTANIAARILETLEFSKREVELARIAGYMHDIGNIINRDDHAQSGGIMAFQILKNLEMDSREIASVISAIGNHDEHTSSPVNAIAAAIILADKSDVRRSRVRNREFATFDIHDRVNYAVKDSRININTEEKTAVLKLSIDTSISSVMDYFEIFLSRMLLCRRAAEFLDLQFKLIINDMGLL